MWKKWTEACVQCWDPQCKVVRVTAPQEMKVKCGGGGGGDGLPGRRTRELHVPLVRGKAWWKGHGLAQGAVMSLRHDREHWLSAVVLAG